VKPLRRFVPLDKTKHDRNAFDCGVQALNTFLIRHARRGMDTGVSYTWVLPEAETAKAGKKRICAWYTLTVAHVEHADMPPDTAKRLPRYPLPVFVLAQLAVDSRCQKQGLGDIALINALRRCAQLSRKGQVPSIAVVVDVLNNRAMRFYQRYPDFKPLNTSPRHQQKRLFIPMKVIAQL